MVPFVVLMAINIFIPFLVNVRSEVIDLIDQEEDEEFDVELSKTYGIIGSVLNMIVGIYYFLVSLGAWKSIKDY